MDAGGRLLLTAALALTSGCEGRETPGNAPNDGPGVTVEIFAPGPVSTELPEFAVGFTPSGDTVFFNRTPPDRSRLDLFYSVRSGGEWLAARPFEPLAGVSAIDPFVSADGRTLYFSSGLPAPGRPAESFNLWRLDLASASGGDRLPLPSPVNSDSSDVFNTMARDGYMVFSSTRDGERRIYETRRAADGWSDPRALALGSGEPASNPAIHPGGHLLIFSRATGDARPDLYLACRTAESWSAPIRLPEPINTGFTEFAPGFDDRYLYFTSERPGVVGPVADGVRPPGDIYRTELPLIEALCE